ncbi:MAG: AraC family transcriptional regulator [Panacibacter sp.]
MSIYQSSITLVNNFPDFSAPGFDMDVYNDFFKTSNSIINATASDIAYPEHWGCLSIKCAFNGEEFYRTQKRVYSVNENNFLVLNEGQHYSSYIFSKNPVESFTLNFTSRFVEEVMSSCLRSDEKNIDEPFSAGKEAIEFIEKLYPNNVFVSPVISRIKELTKNFNSNKENINELYYLLLEKLLMLHSEVDKEISKVTACKPSTRKELYKRLHYAKDFIDSCYASEITLHELSLITLMNAAYFLREFKKYFHTTPYQYLMKRRMQVAGEMMKNKHLSVADVCIAVGYEDVSSFAKLFKKHYGFAPEAYRRRIS